MERHKTTVMAYAFFNHLIILFLCLIVIMFNFFHTIEDRTPRCLLDNSNHVFLAHLSLLPFYLEAPSRILSFHL